MRDLEYNKEERTFFKLIKIGALLTFIAINLRFIVGDIIKPLILFDVLQPRGHGHHFEFHMPSLPDICGDVLTIILFVSAYFFMNSTRVKEKIGDAAFGYCDAEDSMKNAIMKLRDYVLWGKNIFYLAAVGFLFYFFSKYILTPYMEVFFLEEAEGGSLFIGLTIANSVIRLFADLVLVYTYCKFIGAGRHFKPIFYGFFLLRDLLFTNIFGFSHTIDLEMAAPVLDVIFPIILIYATIRYVLINNHEEDTSSLPQTNH